MMYSQKLVTAIRVNGKVLRESGDSVRIPFGSEFSVLLKNKNSLRALARVEIDGVDVTGGIQLIIPANGEVDLERFIKDGNMTKGNKFKFIERTKKIEDGPRGVGAEDGLVRVEFEFERMQPAIVPAPLTYVTTWPAYPYPRWHRYYGQDGYWLSDSGIIGHTQNAGVANYSARAEESFGDGEMAREVKTSSGIVNNSTRGGLRSMSKGASLGATSASVSSNNAFLNQSQTTNTILDMEQKNDAGITVAGSESQQRFTTGASFATDGQKHVMILKLLGEIGGQPVTEPVTVKTKQVCSTCGTVNKSNVKFCRECGTALTLI